MPQALSADARFYRELRFPGRANSLRARLACLRSPGLLILATQRLNRHSHERRAHLGRVSGTLLKGAAMLMRYLTVLVAKAEVLTSVDIEPGVYLSDQGNLIIGARHIGRGSMIHHRVTIGMSLQDQGKPAIGADVWIGPDTVLFGNITIGAGATILPGTVLTKTIPPRAVVQGNPARVVRLDFDNGALRSSLVHAIGSDLLPLPGAGHA